ncbi:MAG: DegT/DnrJ/EryC1/StrS family aminotransferase [Prevotella sp.]|nr:DegT/DnrJ/EryC1/StrS family aminotransferase [Prevotella sp.]
MIRLSKSVVGKAEAEAVAHVIEDIGYLGMGATVGEFEHQLEDYIGGGRRAICVNSGTAALHLAVQAVTRPGDEVLVPSFTFVASYQAITAAGCRPVSCDIRRDTLTLDLKDAERRITSKTTAIMPVYYASNCCMAEEYQAFAREHGLRIIEDAAHAFGCTCKGKKIGSTGDIVCFSFDGIKNITTGEGGAVFTADEEVIQKVSDARLLGVQKDSEKRYAGKRSWNFDVVDQGYRYHMSNIFAAIGKVQLSRFESEFAPRRRAIAQLYTKLLKDSPDLRLTPMDYANEIVPHIFALQILNGKRPLLEQRLKEHDIQYGIQYAPNHHLTLFRAEVDLPVTDEVYSQIISLPMHPELTDEEVIQITNLVRECE